MRRHMSTLNTGNIGPSARIVMMDLSPRLIGHIMVSATVRCEVTCTDKIRQCGVGLASWTCSFVRSSFDIGREQDRENGEQSKRVHVA